MAKIFNMDDYGVAVYSNDGKLIFRNYHNIDLTDEDNTDVEDMYETIKTYDDSYIIVNSTKCTGNTLGEVFIYGEEELKLDMKNIDNLYRADEIYYKIKQQREIKYNKIKIIKNVLNKTNIDNISIETLEDIVSLLSREATIVDN